MPQRLMSKDSSEVGIKNRVSAKHGRVNTVSTSVQLSLEDEAQAYHMGVGYDVSCNAGAAFASRRSSAFGTSRGGDTATFRHGIFVFDSVGISHLRNSGRVLYEE